MTELETQLLSIIEKQQNQLQTALAKLEAQTRTITELENYSKQIHEYCDKLNEKNIELISVIRKLQNPKISENLQTKFTHDLETHLEKLVTNLDLKTQVMSWLPMTVQEEIKEQITPLASQFLDEKEKLKAYHNKLGNLIQELSAKL